MYPKPPLWLDYETFSEIDIKKRGADIYTRDPSAAVLMAGYAIGDGPAVVWDLSVNDIMPLELQPYLIHNQGEIRAFNAPFEIDVTQNILGQNINIDQWKCCQVLAYSMSFAGTLDQILAAIFPDTQKDVRGKKLINKFCKLAPSNHKAYRYTADSHPEDWADFVEYCRTDVEVFRKLWKWLEKFHTMTDADWSMWTRDRIINQRGIPVDGQLVKSALSAMTQTKEENSVALKQITGLPKITPIPLLAWFNQNGVPMANMQKETKENAARTATGKGAAALELSLQIAQASSSSKWDAFDRRTDKRTKILRGSLQFNGAGRTGRWAGRGIQLQNLKRSVKATPVNVEMLLAGFPVTMGQISTSIRSAIKAPEGKSLAVSDLSSIESRVVGWLTNCELINNTFAHGRDTYKVLATGLYSIPYDQVTKVQRTFAKPAALGAQYMLGGKGLVKYAEGYGITLSLDEAKSHIDTYRTMYPELPIFWNWVKTSIFRILAARGNPPVIHGYKISIFRDQDFLYILLPSGRKLCYYKPEIIQGAAPWDRTQLIDKFSFMGQDSLTTQWCRIHAHAGGITENIVQAIAADVLRVWITRIMNGGGDICGHIHDEVVLVADEGFADTTLTIVNALAAGPISWAPGLLLTADGYIDRRYRKD